MKISDSPSVRGILKRQIRFYLTNYGPCPYLPGRVERKVFTNLAVDEAGDLHDALTHSGFRRSQNIAYRPSCEGCSACKATRVPVDQFALSKRWKRIVTKNAGLVRHARPPVATREQYRLLMTYLNCRHRDGGMSEMSLADYVAMVEGSPVPSVIFEYREGEGDDAKLRAVAIADVLRDGLSMVYSFFDPDLSPQSPGSFIILDHIRHARDLSLPFVYLGYWIKGSEKMDYKAEFRPLEVLDGDTWRAIQDIKA